MCLFDQTCLVSLCVWGWFALEYKPNIMLVHEEDILITKDGYERLTTRTPKLIPIIC